VLVEDMEALPREAEEAMLHLHNHLAATGGRLLMTADRPPARWGLRLPDLASRVEAAALARLEMPDDALLEALLAKQFADRQLFPAPEVLAHVARRIERSHAAAARAVAAIDRAGLRAGRQITLPLARRALDAAEGGRDAEAHDSDGQEEAAP
jgi:chromosomal replication initiation ATPase DnaA